MAPRRESTLWRTQNFLRDHGLIERLVDRAGIGRGDVVYDLGAGNGALTGALARRAGRVVAIERDATLLARLRTRFAGRPDISVRGADILRHPLPQADYVVFANPPFDVTSAIVRKLTTAPVPPRDAYLVLQSEAADRYRGSPRQTLAALLIAPWFSVRIVHRFNRRDFVPVPAVDVVMVRMQKRGPPLVLPPDAPLYRDFVVSAFTTREAVVASSLRRVLGPRVATRLLRDAGIDERRALSEIALAAWLQLFRQFSELPAELKGGVQGAEARLRRLQRRLRKIHRTRVPRDALGRQHSQLGARSDEGWQDQPDGRARLAPAARNGTSAGTRRAYSA